MSEEPVLIRRIEVYFDDNRKPVKKIQDASFKYVTLYDEEGELTEQYQVEIVDGVDPELEEEATEEFREDEHPREDSGKFTDKGGGISNVKSLRDTSYDLLIKSKQDQIDDFEDRIAKNPKADYKRHIEINKASIDKILRMKEKNEYKLGELPDIFIQDKPNTHTKMDRGFKADNTKINIGASMMKKDEHPMRKKRYENVIDTIKVLWNGLPDEYRDYVEELKIHNVRGYFTGKSGTYATSRSMKVKGSKVLTMRVRNEDKRADLIHVFLHEIGHAIWYNKLEKHPEKMKQFKEGVDELIKSDGGITPYVQEDHVGMQEILEIFQEQRIKHWRMNRIDSEDLSGEDIERTVKYHKNQLQQIVANETHSEALSFILGGVTKWELGKDIKVDTMKKYFKLVEELHK